MKSPGENVKQLLTKKLKIRLYFLRLFDTLYTLPKWRKFHKVLRQCATASNDFFFVQIGANDGRIYDPIYPYVTRYNWRGILVEPVEYYFNKLKKNYEKNTRLIFENMAISTKDEIRDLYRIKEGIEYLPKWCGGLGTFNLDVLLTHKWAIPNLEDYIVTTKVNCISFESLLAKHEVARIDLLLIDTEGYDYEIIKQIDFTKIRPRIIAYEHKHLNKIDRKHCECLLKDHNYTLTRHIANTLALLAN